ncbi:GerAB/ArcD/ProY family transporter [Bacillus toyonensis]|uniref:GerAB/ArcD/ProY family transporter n=1 Tax=Bacillus toyonensis TaxID=155322 RepID=UPI001C0B0E19|nr:endospore germination permease [Bacillus toyonensis]MBU4642341.1 endospore germination permease [Bacillus toyonensis]
MNVIKINGFQLFYIIFLFEMGSAALFDIAAPARQDAWIVILIGCALGSLLYLVYASLHQRYPNVPFTTYIRKIFGEYVGWSIGLIYVIYYIYIASRVLRDFENLLSLAVYQQTSIFLLGVCMLACIMYAVYKGFEVFARATGLFLIIYVIMIAIIITFEVISGLMLFENLLPILENGWQPVIKQLFPTVLTVPFGEMITFTMLLPYLDNSSKVKEIGILGIFISGLVLSFDSICHVLIIGPDVIVRDVFPVLTTVSYINLAGFIQRIEPLVIVIMLVLGFVKITIFFFCAMIGTADLFQVAQVQKLIYPIGSIILFCSIIIAPNHSMHIQEGLTFVPYYLHVPLQIGIPLLLLATVLIKEKIMSSR